MAAWIKQRAAQLKKLGPEGASWNVVWDEPDGTRRFKSCGPGRKGRRLAQELADRINAQLTLGTYEQDRPHRATWAEFVKQYAETVLSGLASGSSREAQSSLAHFGRILKLDEKPMAFITTERMELFKSKRRKERGRKPKSNVSPATVNKNLREIKAALRVAVDWGFLDAMPKIKFEREPEKLPTYITPEDFARIYGACKDAKFPTECACGAAAWWQALLAFAQMTGWRIGEILALQWADVDLESGRAITRAADNKGKRDEITPLHPFVIEHLTKVRAFHTNVFPWEHHRRTLDVEFASIQDAAGINLHCPATGKPGRPCPETGKLLGAEYEDGDEHECTAACHRYSFHDERRSFATHNALNMRPEALQKLMRHRHHSTTARYINMAQQLNPAVQALYVPALNPTAEIG